MTCVLSIPLTSLMTKIHKIKHIRVINKTKAVKFDFIDQPLPQFSIDFKNITAVNIAFITNISSEFSFVSLFVYTKEHPGVEIESLRSCCNSVILFSKRNYNSDSLYSFGPVLVLLCM